MTQQEQIAKFLDEYVTWLPRRYNWRYGYREWPVLDSRPTVDAAADWFVKSAEFRALQLGTWLNTPDGEVIAQAVEMVLPPFYRQDAELLVAALKKAAMMQRSEGQEKAGKFAFGAICVAGLTAWAISDIRGAA